MGSLRKNLGSKKTAAVAKARERLGFRPQYDIFRMIDDALAFRRGAAIGVLPTA